MALNYTVLAFFLLLGGIFLLAGLLLYKRPPKEINGLYGYRTRGSMRTPERWTFAQRYSGRLMLRYGAGMLLLGLPAALLPLREEWAILLGTGLLLLASAYLFVYTERALNERFD